MSERQPDADENEEAADAAVEPLLESAACVEPAADSRRGPSNQQIPQSAVEVEDDAQEQECQGFRRVRTGCDIQQQPGEHEQPEIMSAEQGASDGTDSAGGGRCSRHRGENSEMRLSWGALACGDFDLDLHARIGQPC